MCSSDLHQVRHNQALEYWRPFLGGYLERLESIAIAWYSAPPLHPKSKQFAATHRSYLADPRTVSGFNPTLKEMVYPIVVDRSSGSKLWDLDGNQYVDLVSGFGLNLFGWSPSFVTEAITQQLQLGMEIGPQSPLVGEVAKLMCELTNFDRAAFCNTGSEAVLCAMRLARTVTGRDLIVIFSGAYHGILDEEIGRAHV